MENARSRKPWTVLAVLALIGVGLAIQLTSHYYDLRSGTAGFHSFCNLNAKMNCDAVAASPYAEFAAGFPLSSFAAGWYVALFTVAVVGRNRFWRREAGRIALLMTAGGLVLSLSYLAIMALKIRTYCLFCLGLDGVALLSFITVLWSRPELSTAEQKPELSKWKSLVGVLAGSVLIAVLGLKLLDSVPLSASEIDERVNSVLNTPALPVDASSAPSIGPANAPITIAEFSDFQCPFCRIGAMMMKSVSERFPTQVRIVFKPFPLDASCNRMITQPMHLTACEAARTGLCAAKQGKFEPVYEMMFERQAELLPGVPAKMAGKAGADPAQLDACVKAPAASQEISRSIEEGIQLGVQSTPTFFVNGHKIEGVEPGPFWTKLVEKLLQNAH